MLHNIYQGFQLENLFLACMTYIYKKPEPFEQLLKMAI